MKCSKWYLKPQKIHGIYIYIYVHPNALFYLKTNLPGLQDVFKHWYGQMIPSFIVLLDIKSNKLVLCK